MKPLFHRVIVYAYHGTNITTARYAPYLAVASIIQPSVLIIGDSRVHGTYDTISDASSDIGNIARSVGPSFGYTKHSSGGNGVAAFIASHAQCVAAQAYFSHVVIELGVNDLYGGNGTTAATVLAGLATIRSYFAGRKIAQATLEPETGGSWGTVASQTISANQAAGNTQRVIINDTLRAGNLPNLNKVFDVASAIESSLDSGYWAPGPISQDGVHENQTGYLLVKSSGVVDPNWFYIGMADWGAALWTGYQTGTVTASSPAPHIRKAFTVPNKTVARARLYASALGVYRPYLNGSRVGQVELAPGWTDYTKRRQYQTYDVTNQIIANGANALGLALGDGWCLGNISVGNYNGTGNNRNYYYTDVPRGLAILYIDYTDGSSQTVITDCNCTATTAGNLSNDLYDGCAMDARGALAFTMSSVIDAGWPLASTIAFGTVPLVAQMSPPIVRRQQLRPVARTSPAAGIYIFDFGQNHSGIPLLKVAGAAAGTVVTLKHGEDLVNSGAGTLYTANLRTATATDSFTCYGEPIEYFEPLHTWHGYRYVQVTGYPGVPPMDAVVSSVIHTDADEAGTFVCSNSVLTQLWKAATWTLRSNMIAMPTDCNQRDERLGWTNDAQVSALTAIFCRDYAAFYSKFCDDMDDGAASGRYPDIAPYVSVVGRGSSGWGEAGVIIPWLMYQAYGDKSVLTRHYTAMSACVNAELYANSYGDYLNLNDATNAVVFQNAWAYRVASIMQQVATILGNAADATAFSTKAATFASNFAAQVASDGTVTGNSQTGYILGLAFGLIPTASVALSFAKLVALLTANNMTCGFVGLSLLPLVLANNGRLDLAYKFLEQTTYPSWGYDFSLGMTTTGENWAAPTRQGSGDNVNSYNHPVRAAAAVWLMNAVAGIDMDPANVGIANAIMRPQPGGSLLWAEGSYKSIRGSFQSKWAISVFGCQWHVVVPPGATATLTIPPAYTKTPMVGHIALVSLAGVTALTADPVNGGQRFSVPSGTYDIFTHA